MRRGLVAVVAASGCAAPAESPRAPAQEAEPAPRDAAVAVVDARVASEPERLAAIEQAINQLDEAAQACWAAAAAARFDIAGELVATIDIAPDRAQVAFARDTTRHPGLAACLARVLAGYRWAPPLHGQVIQLPFRFRAPAGQNAIDRALVPWAGQGAVAVAVLLDQANTGQAHAALFELALDAGGRTGMRTTEREELWFFLGPATVAGPGAPETRVAAGDFMRVPARGAREVRATAGAMHAVIAVAPGGPEGAARAGALPTPLHDAGRAAAPPVFGAAAATSAGFAASVIEVASGQAIAPHRHAGQSELIYLLAGSGTLTVAGRAQPIGPTAVIQVPPGVEHGFVATTAVRALRVYVPGRR